MDDKNNAKTNNTDIDVKTVYKVDKTISDTLNPEIKNYSSYEIKNINSQKIKIVNSKTEIINFVNKELKKKCGNNRIYLGKISNKISNLLKEKLNIDVKDYNISLKGDNVRKIMKDHGNRITEAKRGQSVVTKNDFGFIDDIVLNPDKVLAGGVNNGGKPAIIFEKILGDKYTLVEFVSDKHHTLEVQTMFKHKKKNSATVDNTQKSLFQTSRTDSSTSSSNNNVSQFDSNVKHDTSIN